MSVTWKFHGSCPDGEKFEIEGLNVWAHEWRRENEEPKAEVSDPFYHQTFSFSVYHIETGGRRVRFAASEFSNCMWGFYVQK